MTKAERKAIYSKALKRIEGDPAPPFNGLCALIFHVNCFFFGSGMDSFPELLAQRPKTNWKLLRHDGRRALTGYWWKPSDWAPRRMALQRAIEACKPKPRKSLSGGRG